MKKSILALALAASGTLAVTAISAQEQPQVPGAPDVSRVQAGDYTLDASHTLVSWQVGHFGFNDYFGLFGQIEGTMTLDPANIGATEFDITVPITSVSVPSEGLRDHLLRPGKDGAAPDFFGPEPEAARFVSTSVRRTSETTAVATGQLTMNGNTGPVTMLVEFSGAGENPMSKAQTVGFHARAQIDRTAWGISYAAPLVDPMVDLEISAAFERD
ncbi:MAG: YceI family protein [Erythrobacter sp.]|jgi:polyisoprenoid-binding protein YceI|uniref:YceI family protein n=1 Tax=Qipengyuania citrea TaxID=225971 RepID=UPI001A51C7E3|nr:YceI family protein [Qipengyuania citrea]MBL4719057.1 polyisoprenoid-binding protein [Erythrobacter sp.]MCP2016624.1 polyisoprenoid-binding protein YceI [Qipengyuania citrea]MDE0900702.1 YceI family protein [Erythrobacter sp.]